MAQHEILAALLGFTGSCVTKDDKTGILRFADFGAGSTTARVDVDTGENLYPQHQALLQPWERIAINEVLRTATHYMTVNSFCEQNGGGKAPRRGSWDHLSAAPPAAGGLYQNAVSDDEHDLLVS